MREKHNKDDGNDGLDATLVHCWMSEPSTGGNHSVLTPEGLENIASHKYRSGSYTHLDNLCNPLWTQLTELLPRWLAPNSVTTLGGLHCFISYLVIWAYSPNFVDDVPNWVVLLSGYCTLAYYTLDCMDGKQARRIGASSPLGQLFDHGFDCLCNLAHCSACGGYTMIGGTRWFLLLQATLQFSFFQAQWEEYYTHILPHSAGDWLGVTEVNYGMGLATVFMSFIDRKAFWIRPLSAVLPTFLLDLLPTALLESELRYAGVAGWAFMIMVLCSQSLTRVFLHLESNTDRFSAASKLLSPALIAIALFLVPSQYVENNTRELSIAAGFLFSLITKKMIVFSMAKMTFASIQMDVLPFVAVCLWVRLDPNLTERGVETVLAIACVLYAIRLVFWAKRAINDICHRLGIWCFRIKPKEKKKA